MTNPYTVYIRSVTWRSKTYPRSALLSVLLRDMIIDFRRERMCTCHEHSIMPRQETTFDFVRNAVLRRRKQAPEVKVRRATSPSFSRLGTLARRHTILRAQSVGCIPVSISQIACVFVCFFDFSRVNIVFVLCANGHVYIYYEISSSAILRFPLVAEAADIASGRGQSESVRKAPP